MLDGRSEGYRYHEENGGPVPLRSHEGGDLDPGGRRNLGEIDEPQEDGKDVPYRYAGENRQQPEDPAGAHGDDGGGEKRYACDQERGVVVDENGLAVTGFAHGHVDGHVGEAEADDHDDRTDHHGRHDAMDELRAAQVNGGREGEIEKACGEEPPHGGGKPPGLHAVDDRCDEGEGRTEEDGDLTPGAELEDDSAYPGAQKRHAGVEAGKDRHEHQSAEGDKKDLRSGKRLAPDRFFYFGHAKTSLGMEDTEGTPPLDNSRGATWCRRSCPRRRRARGGCSRARSGARRWPPRRCRSRGTPR